MVYYRTVTSKGQVTIPAKIRRQLNIRPGQKVPFSIDKKGNAVIEPGPSLKEVRQLNQEALRKNGLTPDKLRKMAEEYQNGDGWAAYVIEKYGGRK